MLNNVTHMLAGTTGSFITEELISCWDDRIVQANPLLVAETIILIKNSVEIGAPGRPSLSHLQSVHSSLHWHCSRYPSHSGKLYRKGESTGWKLFWAGAPKTPGRLSTVPAHTEKIGLNWLLLPTNIWVIYAQQNESRIFYVPGITLSKLRSVPL